MIVEQSITREQENIVSGLKEHQKRINSKYFYDKKGSLLFEKITQLEEYYPTRTEVSILKRYADDIAAHMLPDSVIVEPGAGSCEKIQYLLDAVKPSAYFPQDVSKDFLHHSSKNLKNKFPWLDVKPIVSDFSKPITLPENNDGVTKYVFYPGSTLGNFDEELAVSFLKNMKAIVGDNGGVLLGVDLHKDASILEAAYNDSQGVTAEFNLNILRNINRHLDSCLDINKFEHKAFYNEKSRRIEMHLESKVEQSYELLDESIAFTKGETIHTENSYKYNEEDIHALCEQCGFVLKKRWVDEEELFSLNFLEAA